jgi:hypothetical protein
LIDRRRPSSILDVRYFRGADCHADRYLVVVKVRERLEVSKLAAQKIDTERFNVNKLNKRDVKEQYQVIEDSGDINKAWDSVRENIKISAQESLRYCGSKHRKPWFDDECSNLVD